MAELTYKRILLKVSGEALMGALGHGIDMNEVSRIAEEVAEARALGAEISIVIGGGNIFRGVAGAAKGMDRGEADYMGMLATGQGGYFRSRHRQSLFHDRYRRSAQSS